jgi:membrane protease YdiL (CAAX protease family)
MNGASTAAVVVFRATVTAVAIGLPFRAYWLWLASSRRSSPLVLAWNILGLTLLMNIVTIAVLSALVPFRQFTENAPRQLPSTFPFVWLPTFFVQAALFGHLVVFRALRARKAKSVYQSSAADFPRAR